MKKRLINSFLFKSFRRGFLTKIYQGIESGGYKYCCSVYSWHSDHICWRELKEVKENMNSKYISEPIRTNIYNQTCARVWFDSKKERLAFLEECLNKLEK